MTEFALTPELLLASYANGYFPMAASRDDPDIKWYYPEERGIIPLDGFHVPRSLAKFMRKMSFTITTDTAFADVIRACAEGEGERATTWINNPIIEAYCELADRGFAHSVEVWEDKKLVGGLYGVSIAGAFFGESMFSRATNASKVALVHLVELIKDAGYTLLDTQFVNDHLTQFGVQEIAREEYLVMLKKALQQEPMNCF
ncbi:MAG: leucyl/phenylalanyl-tRNA--protein transferase [Alphaproteobacteria bacterium]|nr:leucyl/phenylalanyl-tRNA--protein transferase [Alphaproteobacteria bacterium]